MIPLFMQARGLSTADQLGHSGICHACIAWGHVQNNCTPATDCGRGQRTMLWRYTMHCLHVVTLPWSHYLPHKQSHTMMLWRTTSNKATLWITVFKTRPLTFFHGHHSQDNIGCN